MINVAELIDSSAVLRVRVDSAKKLKPIHSFIAERDQSLAVPKRSLSNSLISKDLNFNSCRRQLCHYVIIYHILSGALKLGLLQYLMKALAPFSSPLSPVVDVIKTCT